MSPPPEPVAFIHVDLDDVWAIGDCYGFAPSIENASFVYRDGLPRLERLLRQFGDLKATFFVVGRDAQSPNNPGTLRQLLAAGHSLANHSMTHALNFRELSESQLEVEISAAEQEITRAAGMRPVGFRAPGYGVSERLLRVLSRRGYKYDASAMPGPWGAVFRWMDRRLQANAGTAAAVHKTQFSRISDMRHYPLRPHARRFGTDGAILELPSATSPLLRLPFQAGVCMKLGRRYFDAQFATFRRRPQLPLLFLLHGADIADFASIDEPFFARSAFFNRPVSEKESAIRYFLKRIAQERRIVRTEDWINETGAVPPPPLT